LIAHVHAAPGTSLKMAMLPTRRSGATRRKAATRISSISSSGEPESVAVTRRISRPESSTSFRFTT
jgi:hypothetical protein